MDNDKEQQFGSNVTIIGHRCYRCKHEWKPNDIAKLPRICPECKSPYWDRPRKTKVRPTSEVGEI